MVRKFTVIVFAAFFFFGYGGVSGAADSKEKSLTATPQEARVWLAENRYFIHNDASLHAAIRDMNIEAIHYFVRAEFIGAQLNNPNIAEVPLEYGASSLFGGLMTVQAFVFGVGGCATKPESSSSQIRDGDYCVRVASAFLNAGMPIDIAMLGSRRTKNPGSPYTILRFAKEALENVRASKDVLEKVGSSDRVNDEAIEQLIEFLELYR